jgi:hypothetical protein
MAPPTSNVAISARAFIPFFPGIVAPPLPAWGMKLGSGDAFVVGGLLDGPACDDR